MEQLNVIQILNNTSADMAKLKVSPFSSPQQGKNKREENVAHGLHHSHSAHHKHRSPHAQPLLNVYSRPHRRNSEQDPATVSLTAQQLKKLRINGKMSKKSKDDDQELSTSPGRRGSLLDGIKDFLNPRPRSRSDAKQIARPGKLQRKIGVDRTNSVDFEDGKWEGEVDGELDFVVSTHDELEESRDKVPPGPLYVHTRLANIIAEETGAEPGSLKGLQRHGHRFSLQDGPEDHVPYKHSPRPRSYSSGEQNLVVLRKASRPMEVEIMGRVDNADEACCQFLTTQTCYDLLPHMSKVIILDSRLSVRRAFIALRDNFIRAAPVWNHEKQRLTAMLTETDFLNLVYHSHSSGQKDMESRSLGWWLKSGPGSHKMSEKNKDMLYVKQKTLNAVHCDQNLMEVARGLVQKQVHRAPVYEPGTKEVLYFISLRAILGLLQRQLRVLPLPVWMRLPVRILKVGNWKNVYKVTKRTSLSMAGELMLKHGLSCLPVVSETPSTTTPTPNISLSPPHTADTQSTSNAQTGENRDKDEEEEGKLETTVSKSDIILLLEDTGNKKSLVKSGGTAVFKDLLESTVDDAIRTRNAKWGDVKAEFVSCHENDSLVTVMGKLAADYSRSIFVLNSKERIVAVMSVSDVMMKVTRMEDSVEQGFHSCEDIVM